jgi:GAF domain-containing protein
MNDNPRLIEIAFPLKQASIASVHEKNVRHGHISTLHIWPARRPLAACRAALLATLLPDPGDPERRKALLDKIGGSVVSKTVEEVDDEGNTVAEEKLVVEDGVLAWGQEASTALAELKQEIRAQFHGRPPRVPSPSPDDIRYRSGVRWPVFFEARRRTTRSTPARLEGQIAHRAGEGRIRARCRIARSVGHPDFLLRTSSQVHPKRRSNDEEAGASPECSTNFDKRKAPAQS